MDLNFSELSVQLTNEINKEDKKSQGIYFTPPETIQKNIFILKELLPCDTFLNILEPACGSGEFIRAVRTLLKETHTFEIKGIEKNKIIFDNLNEDTDLKYINGDFLDMSFGNKYDLIIGNPPYYVMRKEDIPFDYYKYFSGRPNIFILFIMKSLEMLKPNGILSFILPKNFLNCVYYNSTRKYIANNYEILCVKECADKYIDTKQETIIFIVRNSIIGSLKNDRFLLEKNQLHLFGEEESIIMLNKLCEGSVTLSELNFEVNVGNIVWNECKEQLTDDNDHPLLIYSSDVKNKHIIPQKYKNPSKKNYINRTYKTPYNSQMLIINRGYGVGKYKFNYCLVDGKKEYLVENHLVVVKHKERDTISHDKLREIYVRIMKSFENEKTTQFIQLYFGNNAINTSELCNILPIYGMNEYL